MLLTTMDKVIIIFVVAIPALNIFQVNAGHDSPLLRRAAEIDAKCRKESKADTDSAKHYLAGEIEPTEEFKCYVKCVMHEAAVISHTGDFDLEAALQHVPKEMEEIGHKMVHDCKHIKNSDLCQMAFDMHRCYHDVDPKTYKEILETWRENIEAEK